MRRHLEHNWLAHPDASENVLRRMWRANAFYKSVLDELNEEALLRGELREPSERRVQR